MISHLRTRFQTLAQIFWAFFRIGPSTFGGGYAMIPLIEREIVQKRQWMDVSEIGELVSVAGSAPGGVGVNAAAFIGYRRGGAAGACLAVLGITLPTFAIVFLLSACYRYLDGNPKAVAALKGIHGAIVALILIAAYKMARTSLFDKTTVAIALGSLGVLLFAPIHPIAVIASGALGIVLARAKALLGMKVRMEKEAAPPSAPQLTFPEYYI